MLLSRAIINLVPRRLMASSSSSSNSGTDPSKLGNSAWIKEQKRADKDLEKSKDNDHASTDPNDDIFGGQTKVNYNHDGVGFKQNSVSGQTYLNPLLTPPPRSPKSVEEFMHPEKLGHWVPYGFDPTNKKLDRYHFHEGMLIFWFCFIVGMTGFYYGPNFKLTDWARREAFLRTAQREALGLPLIDKNVVDPERVALPTEEDLRDFPVNL